MNEITRLLHASREGDNAASDALLEAVYPELRKIAAAYMQRESAGHTLQPTALLHEAYLKLAGAAADWKDRGHFFALSAIAMRQILVDHARGKQSQKRGSGIAPVPLDQAFVYRDEDPELLVSLDIALQKLAETDRRKARILELRHFGGLSIDEVAEATGVSVATVGRELRFAEAWLKRELDA
jgi:RNA polymerase sigma-70 factor (ECF subfamily)